MNRSIGVWRKSENSKENEAKEEKRRGKMMRSVRKEETGKGDTRSSG